MPTCGCPPPLPVSSGQSCSPHAGTGRLLMLPRAAPAGRSAAGFDLRHSLTGAPRVTPPVSARWRRPGCISRWPAARPWFPARERTRPHDRRPTGPRTEARRPRHAPRSPHRTGPDLRHDGLEFEADHPQQHPQRAPSSHRAADTAPAALLRQRRQANARLAEDRPVGSEVTVPSAPAHPRPSRFQLSSQ